jgi:hypothetical protein
VRVKESLLKRGDLLPSFEVSPIERDEIAVLGERSGKLLATTLVPPIGSSINRVCCYDLTGVASTYAANWRASALTALLRQPSAMDSDMGSGKISSAPFSTPSKIALAADSGEAF